MLGIGASRLDGGSSTGSRHTFSIQLTLIAYIFLAKKYQYEHMSAKGMPYIILCYDTLSKLLSISTTANLVSSLYSTI